MKDYLLESKPRCPSCREVLDGASCTSEQSVAPLPADFCFCLCCGAILRYTDEMQLKLCNEADMKDAMKEGIGEKLLMISTLITPIAKKIQQKRVVQN